MTRLHSTVFAFIKKTVSYASPSLRNNIIGDHTLQLIRIENVVTNIILVKSPITNILKQKEELLKGASACE